MSTGSRAPRARGVTKGSWARRVRRATRGSRALAERLAQLALWAYRVLQARLAHRVSKVSQGPRAFQGIKATRETGVPRVWLARKERLALPGHPVVRYSWEPPV